MNPYDIDDKPFGPAHLQDTVEGFGINFNYYDNKPFAPIECIPIPHGFLYKIYFRFKGVVNIDYVIEFTVKDNETNFENIFNSVKIDHEITKGNDSKIKDCFNCINDAVSRQVCDMTNKYEQMKERFKYFIENDEIDFKNKYPDEENINLAVKIFRELIADELIEPVAISYYFISSIYYIILQIWLVDHVYSNSEEDVDNDSDNLLLLINHDNEMLKYATEHSKKVYDEIDKYCKSNNIEIPLSYLYLRLSNSLLVPIMYSGAGGDCWLNATTVAYHYYNYQICKNDDGGKYKDLWETIVDLYNRKTEYATKDTFNKILLYKEAVDNMRANLVYKYIEYKLIKRKEIKESLDFKDLFINNSDIVRRLLPNYSEITRYTQEIQTTRIPHLTFKAINNNIIVIYDLNELEERHIITIEHDLNDITREQYMIIDDSVAGNNIYLNTVSDKCKEILQNTTNEKISIAAYLSNKEHNDIYLKIDAIMEKLQISYDFRKHRFKLPAYEEYYIVNQLDGYEICEKVYKYLKHKMNNCSEMARRILMPNIIKQYDEYKKESINIKFDIYEEACNFYNDIEKNNQIIETNYPHILIEFEKENEKNEKENKEKIDFDIDFCKTIFIKYLPVFITNILRNVHFALPEAVLYKNKYLKLDTHTTSGNKDINTESYVISTSNNSTLPYIKKSFYDKIHMVYKCENLIVKFECYKEFMITKVIESGKYY